jgi:SAM-dependent methyltransferase
MKLGLGRRIRRAWRARRPGEREWVARTFLAGDGVEVGALHNPLFTPRRARVRYVDRATNAELRRQYPELSRGRLVPVDIIDDGARLATIEDGALDFVIASHFLEHCPDPIGALQNFLRVLRPKGVLLLVVPDKRFTFDRARETTSLEHLLRDHEEGPESSRRAHFEEWVRRVGGVEDDAEAEREIARLMDQDYSIHYHAWTPPEMFELLAWLSRRSTPAFDVEYFSRGRDEMIFVLRRG